MASWPRWTCERIAALPFGFYGLIQPAQSNGDPPLFLHPSLASASLELATPSIHDPSVYLQLPGLLCCAVLCCAFVRSFVWSLVPLLLVE